MFIGMSMDTTRRDMTQAIMEGVSYGIRDSFEVAKSLGIHLTGTRICGGGARSALWRKMIANILNLRVERVASEEGPGLGAAMLAAVACGEYASVDEAAGAIVRVTETIEPDPALAAKYQQQYLRFQKLYPSVKDWF